MVKTENRWWIYQRERFPLIAHGPLVIVFCFALFSFSAEEGLALDWNTVGLGLTAVVVVLSLFFQLRIADEHKDAVIDQRYRSQRPVPRGLVALPELACIGIALCFLQAGLALVIDWRLGVILVCTWIYISLMTVEFFVPAWLKARPLAYMLSHMLVMPLITLLASAMYWIPYGSSVPAGLGWLLTGSFFLGIVLEVGRKIRAPADEQTGVDTYSGAWGVPAASIVWGISGCLAAGSFAMALGLKNFVLPALVAAGLSFTIFAYLGGIVSQGNIVARRVESLSGIYVLGLYLLAGLLPFAGCMREY